MKKILLNWATLAVLLFLAAPAGACTTAVVSGASSADGRPILWKNRDSDQRLNQVVYGADGKYAYLGLANRADRAPMQIWAGVNSAGFAIMNSASYNLEKEDTQDEGRFMKLALQSCASIADFEALLSRTDGADRDTSANFGVIDAKGGAAYFEVGRKGFQRFDATDPKAAPGGILLRTNYSASGNETSGTGFWRQRRARRIVEGLLKGAKLDAGTILSKLARDIGNDALASEPLEGRTATSPRWAYTGDSICRYDTTACAVIAGVRPGEDPLLSTFWVIPGQPLAGAAFPLWLAAGSVPAALSATAEAAPAAKACEDLCGLFYSDRRGDLVRYIDAGALAGTLADLPPILLRLEETTLEEVAVSLDAWRETPPKPAQVLELQEALAAKTLGVMEILLRRFAPTPPAQNPRKGTKPKAVPAPPPQGDAKAGCGA